MKLVILGIALTFPTIFVAFGLVGAVLALQHHAAQAQEVMSMAKTVALVTVPVAGILVAYIISRTHLDRA